MSLCCAPSCRFRSSRCRSLRPRRRFVRVDLRSSLESGAGSARKPRIPSAIPAAAVTAARSSGSSSSAWSWTLSLHAPRPARSAWSPFRPPRRRPRAGLRHRHSSESRGARTRRSTTGHAERAPGHRADLREPVPRSVRQSRPTCSIRSASCASRRPIRKARGRQADDGEAPPSGSLALRGCSDEFDRNKNAIIRSPSPEPVHDQGPRAPQRLADLQAPVHEQAHPRDQQGAHQHELQPHHPERRRSDSMVTS